MIALQLEQFEHVLVVRLPADVDAANAATLADRLAAAVSREVRDLVLDLTHTRYLDSAGIEMLFTLAERLGMRRVRLHAVIPPDSPLARVAQMVSLASAVPIHAGTSQALAAASAARG